MRKTISAVLAAAVLAASASVVTVTPASAQYGYNQGYYQPKCFWKWKRYYDSYLGHYVKRRVWWCG